MIKKFIFYFLIISCFWDVRFLQAQEYGNVYLDLQEDEEEFENKKDNYALKIYELGKNYITDVKEYDDLMVGKAIDRNFSDDFKNKYKNFNDERSKEWEGFVRNGVKVYRFYKAIKDKVVDWVMNIEPPLIFDEDEYEMGDNEEYIETNSPLVIKDFKKVVAYSDKEKDALAVREKYAKDHNLTRPSEKKNEFRRLLLEKDWKGLFNLYFADIKKEIYKTPKMNADASGKNKVKAAVVSKYQYADEKGYIEGVVLIEPKEKNIVLFNEYGKNKSIEINFDKSENIKDVEVKFISPQQIDIQNDENMLVYNGKFPIYYRAKIDDKTKDALVKPSLSLDVCYENNCNRVTLEPTLSLKSSVKVEETLYSAYVISTLMNVADDNNKDEYDFGNLIWEKGNDNKAGSLRIEVEPEDPIGFRMVMIGEYAKYFSRQRYSIEGKTVVVRFDLKDTAFNPLGKEISFWVSTNGVKNYIHKQMVKDKSLFDIDVSEISLSVLWFAFFGGLLLNFMPCVFPILFLKLLSYTKLAKLDEVQIRKNFILNVCGILMSFGIIALVLSLIKWLGNAVGWGMQFQNIYFLVTILWVVLFFLFYVMGMFNIKVVAVDKKIRQFENHKIFEFLSGVFLVMLSTPCMAPYLGTAFGIALAGSITSIILTVIMVGLGLAMPYILVAMFPRVAFYFPKPGAWMSKINAFMFVLLLITIIWLLSIIVAQTRLSLLWHWILYIGIMLYILYLWNVVKKEINKLKNKKKQVFVYKKLMPIFVIAVSFFVVLSFVDAVYYAKVRQKFVEENYSTKLNLEYINDMIKKDNQVLVKVGADWCLTCKYNDFTTFSIEYIKDEFENNDVLVIDVDWTRYQSDVLKFMQKFGRSGLPFYVLFSKKYPDGVVLPEIVDYYNIVRLIEK